MKFDPARYVSEMGEAGRMTFGEAILAEALDLIETAVGELCIVAAVDHSPDHLLLERADGAFRSEGRHRFPELIGFVWREFGGIDRDLHRLLLEDRDPERTPENPFQLVGR